ncbi:group-specific protein [Bacillus sp. Au-Bac7]|uniref:group-specific protein n=1 Tax=Bacillus sp. Au-Bac7 TaxID=2906458 RepID=UPI001E5EFBE6|nr:group-specific protein [Bacillus sp. Au-Bac7]MCE4051881.1 group-specific protein [Bacillus sp. Au-Bac7]
MLEVKLDDKEVRKLFLEELKKHIDKVDSELVFWDTKELEKRTCMCMNTIQKEFFYDSRFPKRKVGNKWYYPAKQTRGFLEIWIMEKK